MWEARFRFCLSFISVKRFDKVFFTDFAFFSCFAFQCPQWTRSMIFWKVLWNLLCNSFTQTTSCQTFSLPLDAVSGRSAHEQITSLESLRKQILQTLSATGSNESTEFQFIERGAAPLSKFKFWKIVPCECKFAPENYFTSFPELYPAENAQNQLLQVVKWGKKGNARAKWLCFAKVLLVWTLTASYVSEFIT